MKSKKGIFDIFSMTLSIGFIAFVCIFGFLFIKYTYSQEILPIVETQAVDILEDYGNDTVLISLVQQQNTNLQNFDFKVDLIFLAGWFGATLIGGFMAATMRKLNKLEFMLFIFIGIIIVLLLLNYVEQIFMWFVTSFIDNTFDAADTYLPVFNFYVSNFIVINIITLIGYLLINQLTRKPEESLTEDYEENASFQSYQDERFEQ